MKNTYSKQWAAVRTLQDNKYSTLKEYIAIILNIPLVIQ